MQQNHGLKKVCKLLVTNNMIIMKKIIKIIFFKCFILLLAGSKHTFSYLKQMDLKEEVLDKLSTSKTPTTDNEDENSQTKTAQNEEGNKGTVTAAPSSSSWASLFKASNSANSADNTTKTIASKQADKPSSILSIQNEQEKENETSKSDKQNLLTLIAMAKDQRAINLAGTIK